MRSEQRAEKHPFVNRWAKFNLRYMDESNKEAWVINKSQDFFGFLPNKQIEHLIIGSFPTLDSVLFGEGFGEDDFAFFNCGDFNRFYDIIKTITAFDPYPKWLDDQRKYTTHLTSFFLKNQIGITDIVEKAEPNRIYGYRNMKEINVLVYNNVCNLLMSYKNIKNVYLICNSTKYWFEQSLIRQSAIPECKQSSIDAYFGRHIALHTLQSPVSRVRHEQFLDEDKILYGEKCIDELTKLIPFVREENSVSMRYKMAQWAATLCRIPDLIQPDILESPAFQEIHCRL